LSYSAPWDEDELFGFLGQKVKGQAPIEGGAIPSSFTAVVVYCYRELYVVAADFVSTELYRIRLDVLNWR